ncbi:hypothetical protein [Chryseobacterium sp. RU33C]|uniref:hypothetical protein n=1 Tax=Chryseobacterium sp. RU33C TaxID=1907398 RepID=UPI0009567277|nr:hypothetical protein [Chryseobacterium sp. RU33C]SIQ06443.1 hypothetical protein SAMN05880573_102161 [Chryseobacterium sp. RU33C]
MFIDDLAGPDIVVIDDTEREVKSLLEALGERGINTEYIKVDLAGNMPEHKPINSFKLMFLDLNYNTGIGSTFDAEYCAELVSRIVPKDKQYYLVTWSKDVDKTESVVEVLREYNVAPVKYSSKLKEKYRTGDDTYNIDVLLEELNNEFNKIIKLDEFYGEIIEIDENSILVNCLLNEEKGVYQIRKFDLIPFTDYISLEVGAIILIRSTTKPGSRLFEFFNESNDKKELFKKPNYFEGLDNSRFFTEK